MFTNRLNFTRTLHGRFLLALLLIGILPLGLIGLAISILDSRAISEQSARELTGLARGVAGQLDVHMTGMSEDSQAIAALLGIVGMNPARQEPLLKELFHHHAAFARLSTFDRSGRLLASSHPASPSSVGMRESFQTAAESGRQAWMVATMLSAGRPSLLIHTPIRDAKRQVVGVLGAVVDLEDLSAAISRVHVGGGGQAFVVDAAGRVLLHEDKAAVQKRLDYSWIGIPTGGRPASPGTVRYDAAGESRIAGYAVIPNTGWTVVVERPEAEILIPAKRSLRLALTGLAISVTLALVAAAFFALKLTRPIRELAAAARAFAVGDPFAPLPSVTAKENELGVLVETFDAMRKAVEARLDEIRALHGMGQAITSSLDLHTVLDVLMAKINLPVPHATTVRLFNKETGLLEPVACRNLDEKEWKTEGWRGGRGIPNLVFERKAARTIRNVQMDPSIQDSEFFRRHALISYLGIPLLVKDESLGVISFYTKEEHEFTNEEVEFLFTLAAQAAMAIHNARLYKETDRRRREAEELARVAQSLTETLDMTAVGERIVTSVQDLFGVKVSTLRLLEPDGSLRALASSGQVSSRGPGGNVVSPGTGLTSRAVAEGRPIWSADMLNDPEIRLTEQMRDYQLRSGNRSMIAVPLRARDKIIGAIALSDQTGRMYSDSEVALVQTFADQAALALENARLYEEMVKLAADLSRSNKVKDEFLSVMSHELRTPLNVVMGYVGMIKDGMLGEINPEQEKALEKVLTQSRDQLGMINGILQATQMEAEGVRVERREVRLEDFLDDLRSGYEIPLGKELSVIWDYPPELPVVHTDAEKLKQVLQNLINNAIKFTEKGNVTVSARYLNGSRVGESSWRQEKGDSQNGVVELKVSDTGVGIAKEHFSVIFERFRQVDSSETRRYGGVGIGLYVVKKFTELLGGKVEVQSEAAKGSTFTVTIPCESYRSAASQQRLRAEGRESNA